MADTAICVSSEGLNAKSSRTKRLLHRRKQYKEKKKKHGALFPQISKDGGSVKPEKKRHEALYLATSTDEAPLNVSDNYEMVESEIIAHLRRKLNRRVEKRLAKMIDDDMKAKETARKISETNKRNDSHQSRPTRFDLFGNYNEIGERITPRPNLSRRSSIDANVDTDTDLNKKAPLPGIPLKSAMKSSTKIPGIKRQVTLTDRKDFINDTQDEDEEIATVTGPYNEKSFTSIQNSDVDLWDFKALPISPVPTPMMFRSDTRELSRLNSSSSDRVTKILQGNITTRCPIDPKILRIYISSSFADTEAERTALIQKTFPGLKSYSFQNGYELQIMDLHWGLKDWIVDDHTAIESNLRILDKCMEGSRTLCFISFLETKLGPMVLPTEIPKEEFEAIFKIIEKEAETQKLEALEKAAALLAERRRKAEEKARREAEKKKRTAGSDAEDVEDVVIVLEDEVQATPTLNAFQEGAGHVLTAAKSLKLVSDEGKILGDGKESNELNLLRTWYQIDENSIPPVYKLQKISTQIKDILRNDPSKRQAAKSVWLTTSRQILKCLQRFAPQVIKDDDELRKYFMTIPEMEMERGLLVADYPNEQSQPAFHLGPTLANGWLYRLLVGHIGIKSALSRRNKLHPKHNWPIKYRCRPFI